MSQNPYLQPRPGEEPLPPPVDDPPDPPEGEPVDVPGEDPERVREPGEDRPARDIERDALR